MPRCAQKKSPVMSVIVATVGMSIRRRRRRWLSTTVIAG